MNALTTLRRKISTLFQFAAFTRRYPDVLIVGAPAIVRVLHGKCRDASPTFYSQAGQDLFVSSAFFSAVTAADFPKTFIDVGANHPVLFNNSYYFERFLGFQTFAVDAIAKHNGRWQTVRPSATLTNAAVAAVDGADVSFDVFDGDGNEDMYSAVTGASAKTVPGTASQTLVVKARTLTSLLEQWKVERVGILSLDIEGFEFAALQGLDLTTTSVEILIIENNDAGVLGDERIRHHLVERDYVFYARFWGLDDVFVRRSLLTKQNC